MNFRPGSNPSHEDVNPMTQADRVHSTPPTNAPIAQDGPPLAQDAFFLPIPRNADEYYQASQGSLRQAVEAQIERLIAFLDWIDIDADLEPSLGFLSPDIGGPPPAARQGDWNDLELDADAEDGDPDEDGYDFEMIDGAPVWTEACGRVVLV